MGRLIYFTNTSVDGYIEDSDGSFDWGEPSEEVHQAINDLVRPVGLFLFGRRNYEVMQVWDHPEDFVEDSAAMQDFADIWRQADKVVYSTQLCQPTTARTGVERDFSVAAVRQMKAQSDRQLAIGGPHLAAQAIRAGLVDEYAFMVAPIVVGGGKRALPDDVGLRLHLVEATRFGFGSVLVRYRPVGEPGPVRRTGT